jgi:hypothetical protein
MLKVFVPKTKVKIRMIRLSFLKEVKNKEREQLLLFPFFGARAPPQHPALI